MFNIIINNTHVANSLNNMYQYNFKNGSFEVPENSEIMITSMQIPYSWYNITTRYNNNSFKNILAYRYSRLFTLHCYNF